MYVYIYICIYIYTFIERDIHIYTCTVASRRYSVWHNVYRATYDMALQW